MPRRKETIFDSKAERASQEAYLREHAFDKWKGDTQAMGYIQTALELVRRLREGTLDETQGGRVFTLEDFNQAIDKLTADSQAENVLLSTYAHGCTGLQFIRWIGGLDPSPLLERTKGG